MSGDDRAELGELSVSEAALAFAPADARALLRVFIEHRIEAVEPGSAKASVVEEPRDLRAAARGEVVVSNGEELHPFGEAVEVGLHAVQPAGPDHGGEARRRRVEVNVAAKLAERASAREKVPAIKAVSGGNVVLPVELGEELVDRLAPADGVAVHEDGPGVGTRVDKLLHVEGRLAAQLERQRGRVAARPLRED